MVNTQHIAVALVVQLILSLWTYNKNRRLIEVENGIY